MHLTVYAISECLFSYHARNCIAVLHKVSAENLLPEGVQRLAVGVPSAERQFHENVMDLEAHLFLFDDCKRFALFIGHFYAL